MAETLNNLRDFANEDFETGAITGIAITTTANNEIRILKVPVGSQTVLFQFKNLGPNALDQFDIERRPHSSASWQTVATVAGDYSTPASPLLEVDGAPVTLASGADTNITMSVKSTQAIRILVSSSVGATTGELYYRFGD